VENCKREEPWAATSKKSTMVMEEYRIDLRAIFSKKTSISDYKKSHRMFSHKTRIVELIADQREEQHLDTQWCLCSWWSLRMTLEPKAQALIKQSVSQNCGKCLQRWRRTHHRSLWGHGQSMVPSGSSDFFAFGYGPWPNPLGLRGEQNLGL